MAEPVFHKSFHLDKLEVDQQNVWARDSLDNERMDALVEQMIGAEDDFWRMLPPPHAFFNGQQYVLADGFLTVAAAKAAGYLKLGVAIHDGSMRDAILHSIDANVNHGAPLTPSDRRRAVKRLLEDDEWGQWSTIRIAKFCGVAEKTVRHMRGASSDMSEDAQPKTVIANRKGTSHQIDTTNIGKNGPPQNSDRRNSKRGDQSSPDDYDQRPPDEQEKGLIKPLDEGPIETVLRITNDIKAARDGAILRFLGSLADPSGKQMIHEALDASIAKLTEWRDSIEVETAHEHY